MDERARQFLGNLLATHSPSGFEARGQRVWVDAVADVADEVWTDAYGNAVAVVEGSEEGPELAFAGHVDEIGFIVRDVTDDGFLRIGPIGGADRTVSKGQHVTIHAGGDGEERKVQGVIGQTAIHLRESGSEEYDDLGAQFVDVGAEDSETARSLVDIGDPVTFTSGQYDLHGTRLAARGIDNRVGVWAAAEGLRRVAEADVSATVYAISTVQEEVGLQGARMVGYDVDPDAVIALDVGHATDSPGIPSEKRGPVELGAGPIISRGSTNHPVLVSRLREAARTEEIDAQIEATGVRTGTDADAFYTTRSGIPSVNVGIPNRYMHTPVEVVDTDDLDGTVDLLAAFAAGVGVDDDFSVDV
jgi:endoglucanase